MQSPISQLTQVLEEVRAKSQEHKSVLQENEAATRAALIDPVLRALGWDTADPQRVIVEKIKSGNGDNERADYALQADGEFKFAIEAKKLNGNLKEHFIKLASYSMALKVPDVFITDGARWHHYQNIGHNNQTPACELSLHSDPLPHVAAYLVQHLDAALFVTDAPVEDRLEELTERLASLQNRLEEVTKLVTVTKPEVLKPVITTIETPMSTSTEKWEEVKTGVEYTRTRPAKMRLPDGRVMSVSTWKDVLVECCRFAVQAQPTILQEVPLLDKSRRTIHLIQIARPFNGSSYEPLIAENRTFHVHTTYSANVAAANCLYILDKVPAQEKPEALAVVLGR